MVIYDISACRYFWFLKAKRITAEDSDLWIEFSTNIFRGFLYQNQKLLKVFCDNIIPRLVGKWKTVKMKDK